MEQRCPGRPLMGVRGVRGALFAATALGHVPRLGADYLASQSRIPGVCDTLGSDTW